ncbi:hypothetical protein [Chryseobacterium sp.]|uniref:hypothetical protein n=1 Tax=Chryseobacterium sp. TaxID=1871047 RepID=UPI0025B9FECE|nr:hypothetical protein [Chryseobacterium sp.]
MKKIIIIVFFPCLALSQEYEDFNYEEVRKKDCFITKIESYNSKTGLYYRASCGSYSAPFEEKVIIPLTKQEKSKIWKIKNESKKHVLEDCTIIENITIKSSFLFNNEKLTTKCVETQLEKKMFIQLNMELRLILESKPQYRKAFYWEFIKK